jgi:peptidoglycan hydrolase-like protein with peptidoglycan-binding domain
MNRSEDNTEKALSDTPVKNSRTRFYKGARAAGAVAVSFLMLGGTAVAAAPSTGDDVASLGFFEYTANVENVVALMNSTGEMLVLDTLGKAITTEAKAVRLEFGVTDDSVVALQERLMELGYMDYDEPTTYFGPQTQYAVQLFQRQHNLGVDGIAGDSTLELLNSEDAQPYTVQLDADGTDVQSLQERLAELGYFKIAVTGHFGPETEKAVRAFQQQNGLFVDGKVGSMTREALYSESAKEAPKPVSTPKPSSNSGKSSSGKSSSGKSSSGKSSSGKSNSGKKSSSGSGKSTTRIPNGSKASALVAFAQQQLGKPYVRGGKGPNSFDCSGLVYYALNNSGIGVHIGYMTSGGWAGSSYPRVNSISELRKGDIVCFRGHVGIYLGNGTMVDASSTQGKVRISSNLSSSSYWQRNFICGRRVL